MNGLLRNKLAFITGAGSGIGQAVCQVLAREGATIIAADLNQTAARNTITSINTSTDCDHIDVEVDVACSSSVKSSLEIILTKYKKPPSIVVNCAGITKDNFLLKMSEADFDDVIKVNLKGTFLVTQIFANSMVTHNVSDATVINLASIVGKYGNIGQTNYCASKAAVEVFTKSAAKEFGKFGIRCNSVLPGFIKTPMTDTIPDKVKDKFLPMIAAGRFGDAHEVAEVIAFLSSNKSSYINGTSIEVTGGF